MRSLAEAICTLIKSIQKSWYYLIFDCIGSSLLHAGCLCGEQELLSSRGVLAQ